MSDYMLVVLLVDCISRSQQHQAVITVLCSKLSMIVDYIKQIMNTTIFDFQVCSREIIDFFFLDSGTARSFKLCTIITLVRVYTFIVGLMTMTLFQGHGCVRNANYILCFLDSCLDSCLLQFKCCMVASYIMRIMHNMNCVSWCVQEIQFTCFGWSSVWACQKLHSHDFLRHNKFQTLHDAPVQSSAASESNRHVCCCSPSSAYFLKGS